jgi:hypothetical protein
MGESRIITNHHDRPFRYRYEVPDEVLADQFDHLDEDDGFDGFFCYRNIWYHLSDFMRVDMDDWHGSHAHGFFSGTLIKVADDGETYRVATWTC